VKVRAIQLLNDYYKDKIEIDNPPKPLGTYCTLGYFDAMEIISIKVDGNINEKGVLRSVSDDAMSRYDGTCNRRNIICVLNENRPEYNIEDKDEKFWKNAEKKPYLFVTMIRVKHDNPQAEQELQNQMNNLNSKEDTIAYYSYTHSEVIVIQCGNRYRKCSEPIFSAKKSLKAFKTFSVFGVREDVLEHCNDIEDENVCVRMSAIIRDWDNAHAFVKNLCQYFYESKEEEKNKFHFSAYDTLGERDMIIEISNISIKKVLPCYRMGEIMTHANQQYHDAFFNVETEIINPYYDFPNNEADY